MTKDDIRKIAKYLRDRENTYDLTMAVEIGWILEKCFPRLVKQAKFIKQCKKSTYTTDSL